MEHSKRRRTGPPQHSVGARLRQVVDSQGLSYRMLRNLVDALTGEAVTRHQIQDIAKERYNVVAHRMRLPAVSGADVMIPMCHPLELLALLVRENIHIRSWIEAAWRSRPSSRDRPWRLVIGWDDSVPGNKQALRNDRKTMVLSFAFIEVADVLHQDAAWFTPLAVRSSVLHNA